MEFADHAVNRSWSNDGKIDLLRLMLRMRRFEQTCLLYYNAGHMGGWLILGIGQETIGACARSVMGPLDHGLSGCRGIGHALAAGMSMESCMAELMGRTNGCSKGKAGMFGFYAPDLHHWGCHGVAGAQTPLAAGLAFAIKHRGETAAVICFLGDGSVNAGVYHESLNLAGLFDLPVVYLIENNGYAMGTSVARSSAFRNCLAERAEAYCIDWDLFSDANPYEMRAKISNALERARNQHRPTVLEVSTYRYYGFTIADANHKKYRTPEEIEERKARDPLTLWRKYLIDERLLDESMAEQMAGEAKAEATAAARIAVNGGHPGVSDIESDVYWEWDHGASARQPGRFFFDP